MKKIYSLIFLIQLLLPHKGWAQQFSFFPNTSGEQPIYNPSQISNIGITNEANIIGELGYKEQWRNKMGPKAYFIKIDWYPSESNFGYGFLIYNQDTNPIYSTNIQGKIQYKQKVTNNWFLSAGIAPSVLQYRLRTSQLQLIHLRDPTVNLAAQPEWKLNLSAGIFSYWKFNLQKDTKGSKNDRAYFGISIPFIFEKDLRSRTIDGTFPINLVSQFLISSGFIKQFEPTNRIEISSDFRLIKNTPSLLIINARYITKPLGTGKYALLTGLGYANNQTFRFEIGGVYGNSKLSQTRLALSYSTQSQIYKSLFNNIFSLSLSFIGNLE